MISAQTRSAFVARENRFTVCADAALRVRIMRFCLGMILSENRVTLFRIVP
jgi:hypothetical protein